jgi:PHD/YefM family antitoxin component YafN of YafNO toxin-antitoxin module
MKIITRAIIANSDIIKNYKSCREKAEINGKVFIFKNNQPDAVLFSVSEYERLSGIIEYLENLKEDEIVNLMGKISDLSTNDIKKID